MGGQPGGTKGAKEDEDPYDMAGLIGALPAKPDEAEDGEEEDDEDEVDVGAGGEADVVDGDDEEPPEASVALRCAMFDSTAGLFFRYRSPHLIHSTHNTIRHNTRHDQRHVVRASAFLGESEGRRTHCRGCLCRWDPCAIREWSPSRSSGTFGQPLASASSSGRNFESRRSVDHTQYCMRVRWCVRCVCCACAYLLGLGAGDVALHVGREGHVVLERVLALRAMLQHVFHPTTTRHQQEARER
jgi:hypothetical protein